MSNKTIALFATVGGLALSAGLLAAPGVAQADTCSIPSTTKAEILAFAFSSTGTVVITTKSDVVAQDSPPTTTSSIGVIGCTEGTGSVTVNLGGNVTSVNGDGVIELSNGGPLTLTQQTGEIFAEEGEGVIATTFSARDIDITMDAGTSVVPEFGDLAINATSEGGNVVLNLEGAAAGGVLATTTGSGAVAVNLTGAITSPTADGVDAAAVDGNVVVNTSAGSLINAAGVGIDAVASGAGDSVVTVQGDVSGGTAGVVSIAGGAGGSAVTSSGTIAGGTAAGIISDATSGPASVTVQSGTVSSVQADAIDAVSGGGNVTVATQTGTLVSGAATSLGILGVSEGGNVTIAVQGTVVGGIEGATNGAGTVAISTTGTVSGAQNETITAVSQSGPIAVNVNAGSVTNAGTQSAILAEAQGAGAVTITTVAGTTVSTTATSQPAIFGATEGGSVTVVANGTVTGGIKASNSGSGAVNVGVGGQDSNANGFAINIQTIQGPNIQVVSGGSVDGLAGAIASSATGATTIVNAGMLGSSAAGHAGQAIVVAGAGGLSLTNNAGGVLNGTITAANKASFVNSGTWDTTGTSDFGTAAGAASNSVTNLGMINTAFDSPASSSASTTFADLGAFHNGSSATTGVVSMMNGHVGDVTTISGLFTGATGHSVLAEDAFLGGNGSTADQLHLGGGSAGQTQILINDTNTGSGAINTAGIVLVTGSSKASTFVLDTATPHYDKLFGGIDHGFYLYQLQDKGGTEELTSSFNILGNQLPNLLTGLQQIFNSAGLGFLFGGGGFGGFGFAGNDRLAFGDNDAQAPRVWMTADNWRPDALNAGRQSLWASELPGDTAGLASSVEVNQSFLSRSFDGAEPSLTMDTGYGQSTASLVGGMDLVRGHSGDQAFVAGLLTGYVQSDQMFHLGGDSVQYGGPIIGLYSSYKLGGLRLDGDVKGDLLKADYLGQTADSASSGSADVFGAELNAAYSQALGRHWSLAPIASLSLSTASIRGLQPFGQQVRFSGGQSALAGMGVRLAGDFSTARWLVKLAATAKISDEFAGTNTAELVDAPGLPITNRLGGVSSDFDTRVDVGRKDGRVSGFIDAGYRSSNLVNEAVMTSGVALKW